MLEIPGVVASWEAYDAIAILAPYSKSKLNFVGSDI
jgi:hypothetical protein